MDHLKAAIRTIPDYPKPGIQFRDVTTLLGDAGAFRAAVDAMVHPFAGKKIDCVAGIEARGFILGGAVAHQLSVGFVPVRKKGKLPYETIGQSYELEYGVDEVEIHVDAVEKGDRILLVDDLIATGGTAGAAIKVWRSEEDGRKLLDTATTEWENSDTVNRPTRLDTQSSSATPANDGQTLSSTDAATATGQPARRAERESSRPT